MYCVQRLPHSRRRVIRQSHGIICSTWFFFLRFFCVELRLTKQTRCVWLNLKVCFNDRTHGVTRFLELFAQTATHGCVHRQNVLFTVRFYTINVIISDWSRFKWLLVPTNLVVAKFIQLSNNIAKLVCYRFTQNCIGRTLLILVINIQFKFYKHYLVLNSFIVDKIMILWLEEKTNYLKLNVKRSHKEQIGFKLSKKYNSVLKIYS